MNGSENENSENKKIENEVVFISEKIKEIVDETEVEVQYKISAIHDPEKISLEKIYQEIIEANKSSTDSKIPFTKKGVPMKVEKIEIPEGYELGEEEYDLQRAWFYRDQLAITKLGGKSIKINYGYVGPYHWPYKISFGVGVLGLLTVLIYGLWWLFKEEDFEEKDEEEEL